MAGFAEHNNDLTSENIAKPNIEERGGALYKIKMLLFRLQAQIMEGSSLRGDVRESTLPGIFPGIP